MAFTLKLGALDLSSYPRLAPGDGFDPYDNDWLEPGFVDSPFAEGQLLGSLDVKNRVMAIPVFLKGASKDLLHGVTRSIQAEIGKLGTQELMVEWADDGATASTFYTVVFARFEPDFSFRRAQHGWLGGVLRIWVNGYGHTGSYRNAATTPVTASAAAVQVLTPSIGGDAPALLDVAVRHGSWPDSLYGAKVLAAPMSQPSQVPVWSAASITVPNSWAASLIGASGAQASQVIGMLPYVSSTSIPTYPAKGMITIPLASAYAGRRFRLMAVGRSNAAKGVALQAIDLNGALGPTTVASMSMGGFDVVDLGVLAFPSTVPTQVQVGVRVAPMVASTSAQQVAAQAAQGYLYHLNELVVLPEEGLHGVNDMPILPVIRDHFSVTSLGVGGYDELGNAMTNPSSIVTPGQGLQTLVPNGTAQAVYRTPRARDVVMRAIIRFPASAMSVGTNCYAAAIRTTPDGALNSYGQAYLASNVGGPGQFIAVYAPGGLMVGSALLPSNAARVYLMEHGQIGPRMWTSMRALDGPAAVFASVGASNATAEFDTDRLQWSLVAAGAAATQSCIDSVEAFAVASVFTGARGIYHLGQRFYSEASDNPSRDVSGRSLGAPPVISPSAPGVAVLAITPYGAANELLDVTVRARERFTLAR